LKDPLQYLTDMERTYGGMVTLRKDRTYLVSQPDAIKHILQDNHFNYRKGAHYIRALEPVFGLGLLTSEGDLWHRQRRLVQPALQKSHHDAYARIMIDLTQKRIALWETIARTGERIDLRQHMMDLTLAIVLGTVFGKLSAATDAIADGYRRAMREMKIFAVFNPLNPPQWVPTPSHLRLKNAVGTIDTFIAELVAERRGRETSGSKDVLSLLLAARDPETGTGMDARQMRDEITTLMTAGHDTMTEALTWTLFLIAQHPDVEHRVLTELSALGSADPAPDDFDGLTFLASVIHEGLRLYPPAWGVMRVAIEPDVVGGYPVRAGARLIISPYVVQRSEKFWPDPDRFDPDRFAPGRGEGRHRFMFFPFGAGPRQCAGISFAMLEAPLVIAMLLGRFHIDLVPGQTIRPLPRVALRANGPVWVTLRDRRAQ
jgi:cytochrome P450